MATRRTIFPEHFFVGRSLSSRKKNNTLFRTFLLSGHSPCGKSVTISTGTSFEVVGHTVLSLQKTFSEPLTKFIGTLSSRPL